MDLRPRAAVGCAQRANLGGYRRQLGDPQPVSTDRTRDDAVSLDAPCFNVFRDDTALKLCVSRDV